MQWSEFLLIRLRMFYKNLNIKKKNTIQLPLNRNGDYGLDKIVSVRNSITLKSVKYSSF